MNKIIVAGRLTKDGETRTTESGKAVYSGSIAVNRKFKNKDGEYDTDFFNFVYWNISDNFSKYLKKGKAVIIEGSLQNRTYDDKDGNKRHVTEIIAERIELTGEIKKEEKTEEPVASEPIQDIKHTTDYEEKDIVLTDADLPF